MTKSLPAFEGVKHKNIVMRIYESFPILNDASCGWGIRPIAVGFDMSTESEKNEGLRKFNI